LALTAHIPFCDPYQYIAFGANAQNWRASVFVRPTFQHARILTNRSNFCLAEFNLLFYEVDTDEIGPYWKLLNEYILTQHLFALHTHLTVPIDNTNRFYIRDNLLEVCLEGDCLNSGPNLNPNQNGKRHKPMTFATHTAVTKLVFLYTWIRLVPFTGRFSSILFIFHSAFGLGIFLASVAKEAFQWKFATHTAVTKPVFLYT
jgi:hypothetical protein